MRPDLKKKAKEGMQRLLGLGKKIENMIDEDAYCATILESLLAMHGHLKHIQGQVLESHLYTCAETKMKRKSDYDRFIAEIIRGIGLSNRS